MAGLKSSMVVVMMVIMVATMQMQSTTAQTTTHVVGDALGWTIPSNGAAAYTSWAAQQTFRVGDRLFFNFTTSMHNVAEVSQAAYGPCTTANPISLTPTGPATITLTTTGTHYYICTVGTHCQIGQKLTVNVTAPTPPPAAAPITPPPAAAPTTPPAATPTSAPVSPPATTPAPAAAPTTSPAAAPTTPPAATPTPTGASPPSPSTSGPSPVGDTTPPPPSPSAASTAVVPATLLGFGLALFF